MTKREFERIRRFYGEMAGKVERSGYAYIFRDCPQVAHLINLNDSSQMPILYFKLVDGFIDGDFVKLPINSKVFDDIYGIKGVQKLPTRPSVPEDFIKIHRRWVKEIFMFELKSWDDKGGKRDSKLNYILKQLEQQ